MYLKEENNSANFYDYINFINLNKEYPRINRLRYLAEHKISLKKPIFIGGVRFQQIQNLNSTFKQNKVHLY